MRRRGTAGAAAALLLVLLLARDSPSELARRIVSLRHFAARELALRRLGGSGTAFDRRYFSFLENARRRLPAGAAGVVILGVEADEPHLYLASYHLAPLPVRFGSVDGRPAPGWIVAVYGLGPSDSARVRARLPEGTLLGPEP